ncbi:SAF domain-containing protein [Kribbella solani]|uniref:Flagella basal body P-ring formation protein FlgA n=1 Tax=Kribbella solani TaxID=236067 RepID=A0A841DQ62_9ACTN|nr:SAF domain-containing protein [Kribbella solani]MBB5979989.1 flagella basal body P-ring formation protein FlgA [Kribbella solani]
MSSTVGTESADRQRQREQRKATGSQGSRLPATPRRRRPALAALAALLVVGGALVAGVLAVRMDERQAVIQVSRDVGVGQKITSADLTEARVAADVPSLIPASRANEVVGLFAKVAMGKGQLLDKSMLTKQGPLQSDKAAVGILLTAGRTPADGLASGDLVELVRIGQGSVQSAVIAQATVLAVSNKADQKGSALGDQSSAGTAQTATVLVDRADVQAVADASGNNRIAVALLQRGTSLEDK